MKHIVIIDDSPANCSLLYTLLSEHYGVSLANSGDHALQLCLQKRPDLILLDISRLGGEGFDIITQIKQIPTFNRIPLILVTEHSDPEIQVQGLKSGARDFITKPMEKALLLHRIELHLRFASFHSHLENMVAKMSDMIATSLAELIEYRDENTGGHVIRTSAYVDYIGQGLLKNGVFSNELTGQELDMIVRAAPLHDIGKIIISDRILLKNGRLNKEEFEGMKRHTTIGAEILEKIYSRAPTQYYLKYAIMIAGSHHERYDGSGYPLGLRGTNIPLCGRIMAVADTYDALTHDRVYHKGKSHEEAYEIIVSEKGTHFDPLIVEIFEEIHGRIAEDLNIIGIKSPLSSLELGKDLLF